MLLKIQAHGMLCRVKILNLTLNVLSLQWHQPNRFATHAARERLNRQLEEGDYDLVILQGDIPESTVEAFEENARGEVLDAWSRVRQSALWLSPRA